MDTRQDAVLLWEAPTLKATWPFDPAISGNLEVKSKPPPKSGSSFEVHL